MSHTPGPWTIAPHYYPSMKEIIGPSFKITAVMTATDLTDVDYQKRTADLRLIAAAPDLLEALEALIEDQRDASLPVLAQARAAIARAKGEA
jgi:hypothetical protein